MTRRGISILRFGGLLLAYAPVAAQQQYTPYVNPLLGTETLWDRKELGYEPTRRAWGAEVFPGSALPNAMVQVSPITMFRAGAGYQYEDDIIYGFSHTNKGHWNLNYVPILPVCGNEVRIDDYGSHFDHVRETARPAYYQVYLDRYGLNAELTSTLRCALHRYTLSDEHIQPNISLLVNLPRCNEKVRKWDIRQCSGHSFEGYQQANETIYFYAECNYRIDTIDLLQHDGGGVIPDSPVAPGNSSVEHHRGVAIPRVQLRPPKDQQPLELRIGFSFVSIEGARKNLKEEVAGRSFDEVAAAGEKIWNQLLAKVEVSGGTEKQRKLFYTALYRSMLWPALRSDCDGLFRNPEGNIRKADFRYYTKPAFWDTYRNKLILLGMLAPDVAADVISSCLVLGQADDFMPTFFHGDHASVFVTGSYLRGIRRFDVAEAYRLMVRNATVEGARPYLNEYLSRGYVSEKELRHPQVDTEAKSGVTKTLEYAYDDYAVARLAHALGDSVRYKEFSARAQYYRNVFDPGSRFMRGRLANGQWVEAFDPGHPYFYYMYREANGWQSSFFAPHDTAGLIDLYGGKEAFETKLDSLFSIPWQGYEAHNLTAFLGQYCHGNQPDHGYPFLYHFIGKPEKSQRIINTLLEDYYAMGRHQLAYAGMDDAGEMSAWYVFAALGFYPYSPADPEYLITVPLFDSCRFYLGKHPFIIKRQGTGHIINRISCNGRPLTGYTIDHETLKQGATLIIENSSERLQQAIVQKIP